MNMPRSGITKEEETRLRSREKHEKSCAISVDELLNLAVEAGKSEELLRTPRSRGGPLLCTMFRVPEPIRQVSRDSYNPRLISFGLYDRDDGRWTPLEKLKQEVASTVVRVLWKKREKKDIKFRALGEQEKAKAVWEHLCAKMVCKNKVVPSRKCGQYIWKVYSAAPEYLTFPIVKYLLVLDAIFLVSFMVFLHSEPKSKSIPISGFQKYKPLLRIFTRAGTLCNLNMIAGDIWLFENQIPLSLIQRMVRQMYFHDNKSGENLTAKAAAEQAFQTLVRETVNRMMRVLPGDYNSERYEKSEESVTEKQFQTSDLKKCHHLLECLYRMISPQNEKLERKKKDPSSNEGRTILSEEEQDSDWSEMRRSGRALVRWHTLCSSLTYTTSATASIRSGFGERSQSFSWPSPQESEISTRGVVEEEKFEKIVIFQDHESDSPQGQSNSESERMKGESQKGEFVRRSSLQMRTTHARFPSSEVQSEEHGGFGSPQHFDYDTGPGVLTTTQEHEQGPSFTAELPILPSVLSSSYATPPHPKTHAFGIRYTRLHTTIDANADTLPTVSNLHKVGIQVKGNSNPGCKVELKGSPWPWGSSTLYISHLNVDRNTERFFRNLVAFEIVSTSEHKLLTYLQCLSDLINSEEDVRQLKDGKHAVIRNCSMNDREVVRMFDRMLHNCTVYDNHELQEIRRTVQSYYLQQWRRSLTEFRERYCACSKPWVVISLMAGFVILCMTALQTIYTIIGNYKRFQVDVNGEGTFGVWLHQHRSRDKFQPSTVEAQFFQLLGHTCRQARVVDPNPLAIYVGMPLESA